MSKHLPLLLPLGAKVASLLRGYLHSNVIFINFFIVPERYFWAKSYMSKPNVVISFCRMRCPACRKSFVFVNRSIFPIGSCLNLVDNCKVCGQKLQLKSNNGGGINYALTMILFFLNILWYWPIFGLSYKDNSFISFLITSVIVVVIVQPWLMRYSRIIFLYFLIKFRKQPQQ